MSSRTIDERVVEMRFDNKDFEKNVATSMSTLDKLKSSLDLSGAAKGLAAISAAAGRFSLDGIGTAVDTVQMKFSAMQAFAITALMDIANTAWQAGKSMVTGMSIDQVSAGFTKYEDKTRAVQTIMSATGKSVEEVNASLKKLNWFTDETSYSFTDMVNNIGKFTSAGVDLDVAVTAMEGIANEAALSGQGINEASRAMYNFAQALGTGTVKLMDWRSIENANMATQEFKSTIIDTALELGTLERAGDAIVTVGKNTTVSVEDFNSALAEGWFTSDVLVSVLQKYGTYADQIYEIQSEYGSAADAMEAFDAQADLSGDKVLALGSKAFKAAQVAKTFTDAIDATKDAVSTSWMQSFEIIFGNLDEASELWTDLAGTLWDVFASGGEARNEMLEGWKELGGRDSAIAALSNLYEGLSNAVAAAKSAFRSFFPELTGDKLYEFTKAFETFTEGFRDFIGEFTEEAEEVVEEVIEPVTNGIGGIADIMNETFLPVFDETATQAAAFSNSLVGISDIMDSAFLPIFEETAEKIEPIGNGIAGIATVMDSAFLPIFEETAEKIEPIGNGIAGIATAIDSAFLPIFEETAEKIEPIRSGIAGISEVMDSAFLPVFEETAEKIEPIRSGIAGIAAVMDNTFLPAVDETSNAMAGISVVLEQADPMFEKIEGDISDVAEAAQGAAELFTISFESIQDVADYFKGSMDSFKATFAEVFEEADIRFGKADTTIGKIKRTFRGLFAIVDIVKQAFGALFRALSPVTSQIPIFSSGLLDVTATIGDWLVALDEAIKRSNLFGEAINFVVSVAKSAYSKLKETFGKFKESVTETLNTTSQNLTGKDIGDAFVDIKNKIVNAIKGIIDNIKNFKGIAVPEFGFSLEGILDKLGPFKDLINGIKDFFVGLKDLLAALIPFIGKVFSVLGDALSNLGDKIKEFSQRESKEGEGIQFDFKAFLGWAMALAEALKDLALGAWMLKLKAFFGGLSELVETVGDKLEGKGGGSAAGSLVKVAGAVAAIAAALLLMAAIDPVKMATSVAAISLVLQACVHAMKMMAGINVQGDNVSKLSSGMVVMAGALLVLSFAIKKLGKMDFDDLAKGIVAMGFAIGEMVGFAKLLEGSKLDSGAGQLILMAGAMLVLASAVKKLGKLDVDSLIKGILALGAVMVELAGFVALLGDDRKLIGTSVAIEIFALSLGTIQKAVEKFGSMDVDTLIQGLTSLGLVLLGLSVAFAIMPDQKSVGLAFSIQSAAHALLIFADAVIKFGTIPIDTLVPGMEACGIALVALGVSMRLMEGTVSGAAALALASASLFILAGGLDALGKVGPERLIVAIAGMAGALAVLGIAAAVLAPLAPVMVAIAGALALLGVAFMTATIAVSGFGAAMAAMPALGDILGNLANIGKAFLGKIKEIWGNIKDLAGKAFKSAKDGISNFGKSIKDKLGDSFKNFSFSGLIDNVLRGFGDLIGKAKDYFANRSKELPPELVDGFKQGLKDRASAFKEDVVKFFDNVWKNILNFFGVHSPSTKFSDLAKNCIAGFIGGLGDVASSALTAVGDFMKGVVSAVGDKVKSFADKGGELISSFISGITGKTSELETASKNAVEIAGNAAGDAASTYYGAGQKATLRIESGIESLQGDLNSTAWNTMHSAKDYAGSVSFYQVGVDAVRGMAQGIIDSRKEVWWASESIGAHALGGVSTILESNSPSKAMKRLGNYGTEGFIIGLSELAGDVAAASSDVGETALNGIAEAVQRIGDTYGDDDAFISPTIRPVIDMTELDSGIASLSDLFSPRGTMHVAASAAVELNTDLAKGLDGIKVNNGSVVNAIEKMRGDISKLSDSITEMQLVMDTGALVGSIARPMDRTLGQRVVYAGRGM